MFCVINLMPRRQATLPSFPLLYCPPSLFTWPRLLDTTFIPHAVSKRLVSTVGSSLNIVSKSKIKGSDKTERCISEILAKYNRNLQVFILNGVKIISSNSGQISSSNWVKVSQLMCQCFHDTISIILIDTNGCIFSLFQESFLQRSKRCRALVIPIWFSLSFY